MDISLPTSYDLGISNGTIECKDITTNSIVTNSTELLVGTRTIQCAAIKNNGLSTIISKNVVVNGYYTANTNHYLLHGNYGGYSSDGKIVIPSSGGVQYGPYKPFEAGIYQVIVNGNDLDKISSIDTYYADFGNISYNIV